jgi:3-oxoadipate enol-lactonase
VTPPPLVLLHGLGTGAAGWRPQIEAFSPSRSVVAPELYGDPPFRIEAAAARLGALLDDRPVDLCGLSLGALVALRYALDRPHGVRRLVLCAGLARLPRRQRAQVRATAALIRLFPQRTVLGQLAGALPEEHRDAARDAIAHLRPADLSAMMREAAAWDVAEQLPSLRVPALVLCGARDRPNLPLSRDLAERLPDAELRVVPDAGHVANLDNPAGFNAALAAHLEA